MTIIPTDRHRVSVQPPYKGPSYVGIVFGELLDGDDDERVAIEGSRQDGSLVAGGGGNAQWNVNKISTITVHCLLLLLAGSCRNGMYSWVSVLVSMDWIVWQSIIVYGVEVGGVGGCNA